MYQRSVNSHRVRQKAAKKPRPIKHGGHEVRHREWVPQLPQVN